MPSPLPTSTPAVATQQTSKAAAPLVPFSRAAKPHIEQGSTQALNPWAGTAAAQQSANVPTYGFLRALSLTLQAINGTSTAPVVAAADAPWNAIANILLKDVNGTPIFNLDGYAAFLARLYSGYHLFRPDQSAYGFNAIQLTSGAGAGDFKIKVEIPLEFARDGLGCLPDMDASAVYQLQITYAATGAVYTTPPTTLPTLTALLESLHRSRPAAVDAYGNQQQTQPPAAGTIQYWTSQIFNVVASQNTPIFTRVGNLIRSHILVFRDTSGSRANADSTGVTPSVIQFQWDAGTRFIANVDTLRQLAYEQTGFDAPAGVVPLINISDPNGIMGHEFGDEWMPTVGSTKLQLLFTSSAAGTLQVITNDIVPGSGNIYAAPSLQVMGG